MPVLSCGFFAEAFLLSSTSCFFPSFLVTVSFDGLRLVISHFTIEPSVLTGVNAAVTSVPSTLMLQFFRLLPSVNCTVTNWLHDKSTNLVFSVTSFTVSTGSVFVEGLEPLPEPPDELLEAFPPDELFEEAPPPEPEDELFPDEPPEDLPTVSSLSGLAASGVSLSFISEFSPLFFFKASFILYIT